MIDYDTLIDKKCPVCEKVKPISEFGIRTRYSKDGIKYKYPQSHCKQCQTLRKRDSDPSTPERQAFFKRNAEKVKKQRKEGINTSMFILHDSRRSDKKRGFENNLTKEFIDNLISKGCSYCGETEIRMSLDRIDNLKGHTQDNVVSACVRCNYLRRDMPYEAMLVLAPALREARIKGLFGDWIGHFKRSNIS